MRTLFKYRPLITAGTYLLVGSFWILSSDYFVSQLFGNNLALLQWAQRYKGLFFIVVTALLLYVLVDRLYGRMEKDKEDLDALYRNPELGLLRFDRSGRIRFISNRLEQSLGHQRGSLRGQFLQNLVGPDGQMDLKRLLSFKSPNNSEETLNLELPLIGKDGDTRWYGFQCNFPPDGKTHYQIVASLNNLTAHHNLRQRLATELHEKNGLINASPDAIWSYDKNFRLLSANETFYKNYQKFTGQPIAPGAPLLNAANVPSLNRFWRRLYHYPLNGTPLDKTLLDTQHQTFSLRLFPLKDLDENILGGVCFAHNITERLSYLERLEKQNKSLRHIAWMQSHLVRAPLARIQGLVRLLPLEKNNLAADERELLQKIDSSTQELDQVIRQISSKTATAPPSSSKSRNA